MNKKKTITIIALIALLIIIGIIIICILSLNKSTNKTLEIWEQSKFDLRDIIPIKIEYQIRATYASCYAFAALDSVETNINLHQGKNYDFSESHVEYITSSLLGGIRLINTGGIFSSVITYIEEGKGPVLESEIPNQNYEEQDYEKLKNAKPIVKLVETKEFEYNQEDLRQAVKEHIVKNGSISAEMFFQNPKKEEIKEFYNPQTYGYCNLYKEEINHVVSIIGWDDNYSRENFPEENRPQNDGAYMAMSFWKEFENDHIIYISYEDITIEKGMDGVISCELY